MTNLLTIAHEYAKAVFKISIENKNEYQWRLTLNLLSTISQNHLIQSLYHKSISPKKLAEILIDIYENIKKDKANFLVHNFIHIITKNQRILLLPLILKKFNDLYNEYKKSLTIEIVSARKLNNYLLQKIIHIITQRLSKTVNIVCNIDPSIIAGIIIRIEDTVIDGSIKSKILRLNNILQH